METTNTTYTVLDVDDNFVGNHRTLDAAYQQALPIPDSRIIDRDGIEY